MATAHSLPSTPAAGPVLRPCRSLPEPEPRATPRMAAQELLQHLERGRSTEAKPLTPAPGSSPQHPMLHPLHPQHPSQKPPSHPAAHPSLAHLSPHGVAHPAHAQTAHALHPQAAHPAHPHAAHPQAAHPQAARPGHPQAAHPAHPKATHPGHPQAPPTHTQPHAAHACCHAAHTAHAQPPHPANAHPDLPHPHAAHAAHAAHTPHGQPASSTSQPQLPVAKRRPAPHAELDHHDEDLMKKLHDQHLSRKGSSPSPKHGDRGQLSPAAAAQAHTRSAQTQQSPRSKVAQHMEEALKKSETVTHHQEWPELSEDALQREATAREVELRVLRKELESRNQEVFHLEIQVKDAESKLSAKSTEVGAISAQVEAKSEKQQAVLQAEARRITTQVSSLKERLARVQKELLEKDEDLKTLQEQCAHGESAVKAKENEHKALMEQHKEQDEEVAKLQVNSQKLQRHMSIDHWRHQVEALLEQEQHDAATVRQRREMQRQIEVFQEEMGTLQSYIQRMEEKCKYHEEEISRRKEHLKALVMEERFCVAAARMGQTTAEEMKKGNMEEQRALQAKLQDHMGRQSSLAEAAKSYHNFEEDAKKAQEELKALTACVKEAAKAMKEYGPVDLGDVDHALNDFIHQTRKNGELVPPIVRVSNTSHLVANHLTVFIEISSAGKLCVRTRGGLVPLADFLRKHGYLKSAHQVHAPKAQGAAHPAHLAAHPAHMASHPAHPALHPAHPALHPAHPAHPALHPAHPAHPPTHPGSPVPKSTLHKKTAQHAAAEAHSVPHTVIHHQEGSSMAV